MDAPPPTKRPDSLSSTQSDARTKSDAEDREFFAYMKVFLVPTLVLKMGILYFGIHYSSNPDVGYGWGLVICIVLSLFNFGIFIYKNWSAVDEDEGRR